MDYKLIMTSKFDLGNIVAAATLYAHCKENGYALIPYFIRHAKGDWGNACKEDWEGNEYALKNSLRLLSSYKLPDGKNLDNHRMG